MILSPPTLDQPEEGIRIAEKLCETEGHLFSPKVPDEEEPHPTLCHALIVAVEDIIAYNIKKHLKVQENSENLPYSISTGTNLAFSGSSQADSARPCKDNYQVIDEIYHIDSIFIIQSNTLSNILVVIKPGSRLMTPFSQLC